jgi:hypothetical protein
VSVALREGGVIYLQRLRHRTPMLVIETFARVIDAAHLIPSVPIAHRRC